MRRIAAFVAGSFVAFAASGQSSAPSPWGTVPSITVTSGNYQQLQTIQVPGYQSRLAGFEPLQVIVKDGRRVPLANVPVTFTCRQPAGGYCMLDPKAALPSANVFQVKTDAKGLATLDSAIPYGYGRKVSAMIYDGYGPFTVVATYGMYKVTFNLTVLPDPWTSVAIVSGDNQKQSRTSRGPPPMAKFAPLKVAVRDRAGKGVANVQVVFKCRGPYEMRCQMDPGAANWVTALTDGNGIATMNQMLGNSVWAYYADGSLTVDANAGIAKATFHLTVGN